MVEQIARKLARRTAQLVRASESFVIGESYTEGQVNDLLAELFDDHVFARRLLIEWGFLGRDPDGSKYWRIK
ncbi:MAG: DUF2087 domain-containing protein [Rhodoluna sp.]|jgi:hypothetical protein|nr:DUF2087 domain-containing protein [Rhodoluna sp.]